MSTFSGRGLKLSNAPKIGPTVRTLHPQVGLPQPQKFDPYKPGPGTLTPGNAKNRVKNLMNYMKRKGP